jgi:hypothetical protein
MMLRRGDGIEIGMGKLLNRKACQQRKFDISRTQKIMLKKGRIL